MKRQITREDIAQLTDSQKKHLSEMWYPEKYDLAVANICTNAETEEYEQIEFVVGDVKVYNTHFVLYDLMFLNSMSNNDDASNEEASEDGNAASDNSCCEEEDSSYVSDDDSEYDLEDDSTQDEDFEYMFIRPTTFSKEECLPLLNIAQMIEILNKNRSKSFDFYLLADNGESMVEMGSKDYNLSGYGSEFDSKELCDVLWDCVKFIL